MMRTRLLFTLLLPTGSARGQVTVQGPALPAPPPRPGAVAGSFAGKERREGAAVVKLPEVSLAGSASYAVMVDTLDFRPKWTIRLLMPGPDSVDLRLIYGDSLAPPAGSYPLTFIGPGISHPHGAFVARLRAWDGERWQDFAMGDPSRITLGSTGGPAITGAAALRGAQLAGSALRQSHPASWRSPTLTLTFTAVQGRVVSSPAASVRDEEAMMARAFDGLLTTWIGAMNGDGTLTAHTETAVRQFVAQRWGPAVAVDSVAIQGTMLWVRLRGLASGRRCARRLDDLAPTCDWSPGSSH